MTDAAAMFDRDTNYTAEVQDLYDNAPIGYHSLDINGRFVRINQTELDWLGYTPEEMLGHSFADFITAPGKLMFPAKFLELTQAGVVRNLEYQMVRKDGSTFPCLVNATAIYDAAGAFVMSRSTLLDNTAAHHAAAALQLANAEMARAVRLKDEFLANMSHELRTPLTGILALAENLLETIYGPLNERQEKALRNIDVSAQHLLSLINDLLDLSKIEAGRLELDQQLVGVNDICQSSLAFVRETAHKKNIQLTYAIDQPAATVFADARRLKQMLVNLLSNAVKFTLEGGRVDLNVSTTAGTHRIQFAVQDTGQGISAADQARLFQPFTQLDNAMTRGNTKAPVSALPLSSASPPSTGGLSPSPAPASPAPAAVSPSSSPPPRTNPPFYAAGCLGRYAWAIGMPCSCSVPSASRRRWRATAHCCPGCTLACKRTRTPRSLVWFQPSSSGASSSTGLIAGSSAASASTAFNAATAIAMSPS